VVAVNVVAVVVMVDVVVVAVVEIDMLVVNKIINVLFQFLTTAIQLVTGRQ